ACRDEADCPRVRRETEDFPSQAPIILKSELRSLKSAVEVDFQTSTFRLQPSNFYANPRLLAASPTASTWRRRRGRRFESKEHAVVLGGQHIEETVGTLTHVADALLQLAQHRLAVQLFPLVVEV